MFNCCFHLIFCACYHICSRGYYIQAQDLGVVTKMSIEFCFHLLNFVMVINYIRSFVQS